MFLNLKQNHFNNLCFVKDYISEITFKFKRKIVIKTKS